MSDAPPDPEGAEAATGGGWAGPVAALVVVAAAAAMVGVVGWRATRPSAAVPGPAPVAPTDIPQAPAVPEFTLTERSGRPVTRADLLGRVWVVGFIFTRCPSTCPMITASLKRLAHEIRDPGVGFLSISVDPAFDSLEVLRTYASDADTDRRWWYLTGPEDQIRHVVRDGFKLALALSDDPTKVVHSDRLAIVDRVGRVRAWARGTEDESVAGVPAHVAALLAEPAATGGPTGSGVGE